VSSVALENQNTSSRFNRTLRIRSFKRAMLTYLKMCVKPILHLAE
jgi:hypothetical protein